MQNGQLKLWIHTQPYSLSQELYIARINESKVTSWKFGDKGEVIATDHKRDGSLVEIQPVAVLPEYEMRDLITAFSDLARERGLESESESLVKGKYSAQSEHLKDLRHLLKLPKE